MCNAGTVAHSSCLRTSPEGGKPLEPRHHPCQHPRKNVQHHPGPDNRTTSRHRSGQTLSHPGGSRDDAGCGHDGGTSHCRTREDPREGPGPHPISRHPDPRNRAPPCPHCTAHSGTFCTEGNRLHTKRPRFVTFCTKRPHTPSPPTRPGALGAIPLAHVEGDSHPHDQEPRPPQTDPTHNQTFHPTHTTNTTPTNKYRSHDKQVPFSRRGGGAGWAEPCLGLV